jgi:2-polyprenyl-3-methyl-5-hydroxy-6-metoxy-1,4-benzoquinol methylase
VLSDPIVENMAECTRCTLCENPGTMAAAKEGGPVPCNVRRFRDHVFTLWRCTGCGSIHCAEDADLAVYYADYPLKFQKVGFAERVGYANRLRLLKQQGLRESDRILDYGCGTGLFVDALREKGWTQAFGYDAFVPAYHDPQRLREQYDAVVSYDVIEHDDDPREFMRRVTLLVRAGGLLVIGTPNADHVSIARKGHPSLHSPYHRHILSQKMLLALGREQGLEPAHIYRRSFYDSLVPTVNSRFLWSHVEKSGLLDTAVEPPRTDLVLRSPDLLFFAFFGYFVPPGDWILVSFRKP